MAISIKSLKRVSATQPPRFCIYGPEGMGKTTLASEFPNPVFLQIEDGTPSGLTLDSFGVLTTFEEVMEAINALYTEDHGFQTVVVDSLDRFEPLVWDQTCKRNDWRSIEAPGYGKGYKEADYDWRDFMGGLNALRTDKGMAVVLIGHSDVGRFDDPTTASYSRYDLRIHSRACGIIKDDVDAILLINQDVTVTEKEEGFGKKRSQANGGGNRWIFTEARPAFAAKNRYGMPSKFLYQRGKGFDQLAKFLPGGEHAGSAEPPAEIVDAPKDEALKDDKPTKTTKGKKTEPETAEVSV